VKIFSAAEVDARLDDLALIDRLEALFRAGCEMPTRHHHTIAAANGPGSADATLLLMPAWTPGAGGEGTRIGIKLVTVFPDNGKRSLPSIFGQYLLLDGRTGAPLALLDGTMLTKRRTAAASGLASRYLSRPDARSLLMIGTGALAPHLVRVHARVRPIERVTIWGRDPTKADRLAAALAASLPEALGRAISVRAAADRRSAVSEADIISCATLSKAPLIEGDWLRPGQHLDLVGAYTPEMRESDDTAVRRARVHVDTRAGALKEAGDIVQPIARGVIGPGDVVADLFELAREEKAGRSPDDAENITLFKSVGAALEDLAAANLAAADAPAITPNCP
jgi:ornithine cyclodeaminase